MYTRVSVFLVAPECSLPAPLFIFDSFLSQSIHFRHKFVSSLFSLAAPLFSLVAPKKKADVWSDLQSDRTEYKDFLRPFGSKRPEVERQSDYRIANAYTQRDWIANPVEPLPIPSSHIVKIPTREIFTSGPYFFTSGLRMKKWRPLFFTSGPLFFVPGPGTFFYSFFTTHHSPFTTHQQTPSTNYSPSTLHLPPSTLSPPPSTPPRCNQKITHARASRARARRETCPLRPLC